MNGFETILPFLKPIEHLILDDSISEVMVNGPDRIFIEKAGFVEPIQGVNLGEKSLMVAVKNIARRLGDDISESKPILDSRLPDGSRVAAVIPPCSVNGVTLTIRKFNARHFGIEDLVQAGTLEQWLANQLENYILARKNILIAGGAGSGKTTMLNVLGKFISSDERILLIEDTSEIHMDQDNLVRFEARQPQNGLPAITIRDLLKASLRHRPDRIILGEIRGGEAFDLLQLLNTGHSGSFQPYMPLLQGRALPGSRAAFCRAAWTSPIAPSKPMSVIPSTSSCISNAARAGASSPKSWKSMATTLIVMNTTTASFSTATRSLYESC
jgi:Flp pilus assembly CpaF family ATPase